MGDPTTTYAPLPPARQSMKMGEIPDQVLLYQMKEGECLEAVGAIACAKMNCNPFENNNKFEVYNITGMTANGGLEKIKGMSDQKLMTLEEDASFCCRMWCGPFRSFEMTAYDAVTRDRIFKISRPFGFTNAKSLLPCCCCMLQEMTVHGKTDDEVLGTIKEEFGGTVCTGTNFSIADGQNQEVNKINANLCGDNCCVFSPTFHINEPDGATATRISNHWMGWAKECCMDVENFGVDFKAGPSEVKSNDHRKLHLAMTVLLKYLFFETNANHQGSGN